MIVGLVLAGMILGAVAAATWALSGGSMVLAFALYGLVAAFSMLAAASGLYLAAERWDTERTAFTGNMRPTR